MPTPAYSSKSSVIYAEGVSTITIPVTGALLGGIHTIFRYSNSLTVTSVVFNGTQSLSAVTTEGSGSFIVSLYSLKNPGVDSGNVVITLSGLADTLWGMAVVYTNPNQTTLIVNPATHFTGSTSFSEAVTSAAGDLAVAFVVDNGGSGSPTFTPSGGTSVRGGGRQNATNGEGVHVLDMAGASTATLTGTFDIGNSQHIIVASLVAATGSTYTLTATSQSYSLTGQTAAVVGPVGTAVVTGTVIGGITQNDIIASGKTIILTLTGNTWVAAGAGAGQFDTVRQAIWDGIIGSGSEAYGFNNVKSSFTLGSVIRTSSTVVTITLPTLPINITASENINVLIPGSALTTASGSLRATLNPAFTVYPGPFWVSTGSESSGTGAISPAWPSHQTGDIGLMFIRTENQAIGSTPTGWVAVTNSPQGTGTAANATSTRLTVLWKRAASNAEGALSIGDSGDSQVAAIVVFRGCIASGDPWDITNGDTGASSTSVTIPGATTTKSHTLVVAAVANEQDTNTAQASNFINSNLTSLAIVANFNSLSGDGGGVGVACGWWLNVGAYGATAATLANAGVQGRMSIALKPVTASTAYKVPAAVATFSETGIAANIRAQRKIAPAVSSFVLTGFNGSLIYTQRGTLGASPAAFVLSGTAANLLRGRAVIATSQVYSLSGVATGLKRGIIMHADVASFEPATGPTFYLTGVDVGFGRRIVAVVSSFALTGIATGIRADRKISASVVSFAETGISNAMRYARVFGASTASFVESGINVNLYRGKLMTTSTAAFTESGIAAALRLARRIGADVNAFTVGGAANLLVTHRLIAAQNTYALSGIATGLHAARLLTGAVVSFGLTGNSLALNRGRGMPVSVASFALTGIDASILATRLLGASARSYVLNGITANLLYGNITDYVLLTDSGVYVLTANTTGIRAARLISPTTHSFAEVGINARLLAARHLGMGLGEFVDTGADARLLAARRVGSSSQVYTLSGVATSLMATRGIQLNTGTFVMSGQDAGVHFGYRIAPSVYEGIFAGEDVLLRVVRVMPAGLAEFELDVNPAVLVLGGDLIPEWLTVTGTDGGSLIEGLTPTLVQASSTGNACVNDGMTLLHFKNTTDEDVAVVVYSVRPTNAQLQGFEQVTIPAGEEVYAGPYPLAQYSRTLSWTYSSVGGVSVEAFTILSSATR